MRGLTGCVGFGYRLGVGWGDLGREGGVVVGGGGDGGGCGCGRAVVGGGW